MQNPEKPNYLAKRIDHQKSAASTLPKHLLNKYTELNKLTQEIKALLDNGLPDEILKSLCVVKYQEGLLVISVQSQTAANHLKYQSTNLINILKEQSLTFSLLKNIDVIVTYPASIEDLNENTDHLKSVSTSTHLTSGTGQSPKSNDLTESTKRTIAHTIKHVIKDKRLKIALSRLINPK